MKKKIIFVWGKYAPYHLDRIEAVQKLLGNRFAVSGIQKTGGNKAYAWDKVTEGRGFSLITLFPNHDTPPCFRILFALLRNLLHQKTRYVFLCEYQLPHIFFTALICHLFGKKVFVMANSKFDDKPRKLGLELCKPFLFLPYNGALVSGRRAAEYLRFLGFRKRPVEEGYNTLSIKRVRRNAAIAPAPDGTAFTDRHFTMVSRFVPKKNIPMLVTAYARYRELAGEHARELHLCGSGPEETTIRARMAELGVEGVVFHGFQQEEAVAKLLGTSLCLLLPSFDEQWGLVVNEAIAMGLPVLCGETVGARDSLVQNAINGYSIETDNPEGLARLMLHLSSNEAEWRRMAKASLTLSNNADCACFAKGVKYLLKIYS
ncbi:MAG TPA: glycosyl transferase family 1 [Rhodospirillaceae bacterium]|nr:MAG: hypothetical protein A2018_00690 [Alphaproteobacteria bacterium GWF2_58_20]HAU28662.1 glycosyl transferase family 1 [Rhodospirillaceae bacterium]